MIALRYRVTPKVLRPRKMWCGRAREIRAMRGRGIGSPRGVSYTVWDAFISVADPCRNLSDAETRVLRSTKLYANLDYSAEEFKQHMRCLPSTQETSWEIPHLHTLSTGIESLYHDHKPPIRVNFSCYNTRPHPIEDFRLGVSLKKMDKPIMV